MKASTKKSPSPMTLLTLTAALSAGLLATSMSHAGQSFDPKMEVTKAAAQLQFEHINPAIQMAPAYGNKAKGGHGTFGKFPANFTTPGHKHTGAYHGVVLKGEMTNPFNGEKNAPKMGPGSYWYVPAGMPHTTACVSSTPCEFYFHAGSEFDFQPLK